VVARRAIASGEVVFRGEGRPYRLVTRSHVRAQWEPGDQELFRHYAVPISDEVYAIWDEDPTAWAPMNHSCAPNTGYRGLDVVALRSIAAGEELTLDYGLMLNEESASFTCQCGAPSCRGTVQGRAGTRIGRPPVA
jgi:D-alanine-D-alanine ligase